MSELTIVDTHWVRTLYGDVFHHITLSGADLDEITEGQWWGSARLDCGRRVSHVQIPGVLSRMSTPRCKRCCKVTGLPEGDGSPKNDPECRRLLGLEAS